MNRIIDNVTKIEGQSMFCIGRAADMLWIQFGKRIFVKNRKGLEVEKGEYAIHVQCPWRFRQKGKIILGSRDVYIPSSNVSELDFNWETIGMSIFDKESEIINNKIAPINVEKVDMDMFGTLKIIFDNEVIFEAFTDSTEEVEFWRFINNNTKEHTVVFDKH